MAKTKKRPSKPSRPAAKVGKHPRKPMQRPAKVASRHKPSHRPSKPVKPAAKPIAPKPNGNARPALLKPEPKPLPKPTPPPPKPPEPAIPADKDLSTKTAKGIVKDRIVLMVPDPHWLHAHWELTMQSVLRAEAALGQEWYGAKPVIRLFDVTSLDTTSTAEAPVRDIAIHGGVSHWYIDVPQPPRTYRADIGYITRRGHFHPLCRSNVVTPPLAGASEPLVEGWSEDDENGSDKNPAPLFATPGGSGSQQVRDLPPEPAKRSTREPAYSPILPPVPDKLRKFGFDINAELIVTGRTDPNARVSLQNEPVKLRTDGTFIMRYALTDGRQIIPAVATSADGMEERTIVLAIERNTKHLDPAVHDLLGES